MITPEKPEMAEVIEVEEETIDTKTFTVRYADAKRQEEFHFVPGKFMMVSVFGIGEIPISISSSPYKTGSMAFTVANVGNVTNAMHELKKGGKIGLRGPFGNGYPMPRFLGKNILFISGGCGLAPLRSAIFAVQEKKSEFGKVAVLFGCKTPSNILFKKDQQNWGKEGFQVLNTVDKPDEKWQGNVGVATALLGKIDFPAKNTVVMICGPQIMMHFALVELQKKGFDEEFIFASMERMMQCGVGYCSHCNIGSKYTCIDGPVFSAAQLKEMPVKED